MQSHVAPLKEGKTIEGREGGIFLDYCTGLELSLFYYIFLSFNAHDKKITEKKNVMIKKSGVMCEVSGVTYRVSPFTFHMSITPTATATDPPPTTPPLCTAGCCC